MRLWPRLDRQAALALYGELAATGMNISALAERSSSGIPELCRFASSGGTRASTDDLQRVRETIVETARSFGYPRPATDPVAFDRDLAPRLADCMPMAVGDALNRDVWSFTSIVLAPDVTLWRFGPGNQERWICSDRTRHMFGRLWWHAFLLGGERSPLGELTESDLNQLLERTSLGGCRPLVRELAQQITTLRPESRSREVVRQASLRALRILAVVDPYAMTPEHLSELVSDVVAAACTSVEADGMASTNPFVAPPR